MSADVSAAQIDLVDVAAARLLGAEGRRDVAEAELDKAKQRGDQVEVAKAKVAVVETEVAVKEAELRVAKAELRVAKAKLGFTEGELEKAKQKGDQVAVAEAKVAVAEAKVAVEKQEVAVAEAKAALAGPNEQGTAKAVLDRAIRGLAIAQDAYERALDAGARDPAARRGRAEAGDGRTSGAEEAGADQRPGDKRTLEQVLENVQETRNSVQRIEQTLEESMTLQISRLSEKDINKICQDLQIGLRAITIDSEAAQVSFDSFCWDDRDEPLQHDRYLPHLRRLLVFPHLEWVRITNGNFLDSNISGVVKLRGNTDVALILKGYVRALTPRHGACLLVELKKTITQQHVWQAMGELIAQSVVPHLEIAPVVLLTDLKEDWRLYWMQKRNLCMLACGPSTAVNLLRRLFSNQPDEFHDVPALKERALLVPGQVAAQGAGGNGADEQNLDGFDAAEPDRITAQDILEVEWHKNLRQVAEANPFWPSMFS